MTTFVPNVFAINGVVSTDKSVMQNLNMLANACGCWVTYDIALGKWSVVINRAGTSVASFTDSNIIGGINITGTGVSELYNAVTIEFPHKDLRDQTDYIDFELDSALRFPNELDNKLNISLDVINNPIQAEYIAVSELKQSRIDKVITFRTDYTNLGLKAGDLIDVTNSYYGYASKVFRIIKMEEDDAEGLVIAITALEYDADVYSTAGLNRKIREKKTGIVPKDANEALTSSDNQAMVNSGNMISALAGLFNYSGIPQSATVTYEDAILIDAITFTAPYTGSYLGQILFDQNSSAANGQSNDNVVAFVDLYDSSNNEIASESSGGKGAYAWTDFSVSIFATLTKGQVYQLQLRVLHKTPTFPSATANFTVSFNIFTVGRAGSLQTN
jgi:hypothetical protein